MDTSEGYTLIDDVISLRLLHLMIKMMLADGVIENNEKIIIQKIYNTTVGKPLNHDELEKEIKLVKNDTSPLKDFLKNIEIELHQPGKEAFLLALLLVAVSNGDIAKEQLAMLKEVEGLLGIDPELINKLLNG